MAADNILISSWRIPITEEGLRCLATTAGQELYPGRLIIKQPWNSNKLTEFWAPHKNIKQAQQILEGLRKQGWKSGDIQWREEGFRILIWWQDEDEPCFENDNLEAYYSTLAEAICQMALKVLTIPNDDCCPSCD